MNNPKLKGFIEVLIPITVCNLKCAYCYVMQRSNRTNDLGMVEHTPEEIAYALRPERLGGNFYISLCGAGETTLVKNIVDITKALLEEGHFVNITTNGTITNVFENFVKTIDKKFLSHLNFSFSLHYLELKNKNLLDRFWKNVDIVRKNGCSFLIQINLYDEYLPYWDEIKQICVEQVGAPPQVAATRKEHDLTSHIDLYTNLSREEYEQKGNEFNSPLFNFTMRNFMVKRHEFCYAGKWTFVLNLQTGVIRPCYCSLTYINIYKDLDKKIEFYPIGKNCQSPFCMNSSHFIALGCMPEYKNAPTYAELRNREEASWYTPEFKHFVSQKLYENNSKEYSKLGVFRQALKDKAIRTSMKLIPKHLLKRIKRKIR